MAPPDTGQPSPLSTFLRDHREALLRAWEGRVQDRAIARTLTREELRDHLPQLLDRIATIIEHEETSGKTPKTTSSTGEAHAYERLDEGFDLVDVVNEFAELRMAIHDVLGSARPAMGETTVMHRAIDEAIATAVSRYTSARHRALVALDRLSAAAFRAPKVLRVLDAMNEVLVETLNAVDGVSVYLRDGDRLVLAAAVGPERADVDRRTVTIGGASWVGRVAASGEVVELSDAATAPDIPPSLEKAGIRGFYAVPIRHDGAVVGVAHMTSCTAAFFSGDDKIVFRAMVERAALVLAHHRVLVDLESERARLHALIDGAPFGLAVLDEELRYLRVNEELARQNGRPAAAHAGRSLADVLPPDIVAVVEPPLRRALRTGLPVRNLELSAPHPATGTPMHVELSVSPVHRPDGSVLGVGAWVVDATERVRRDEERLRLLREERRVYEEARFLAEATRQLATTLDLTTFFERLATLLVPRHADSFGLVLRGDDGLLRRVATTYHEVGEPEPTRTVSLEQGIVVPATTLLGRVATTGEGGFAAAIGPSFLEDLAFNPAHLAMLRRLHLTSWLGVPLFLGGKPMGALSLGRTAGLPPFAAEDLPAYLELARRAGIALDNAYLHRRTQEALQARDEVLSVAAHDLRNPLAAVQLRAETLLRHLKHPGGVPREKVEAGLEGIIHQTQRIGTLLDELLDVSRIQAGRLSLVRELVDLRALVQEVVERHEMAFQAAGCGMRLTLPPGPVTGQWDRLRLEQVLSNLLSNAAKYGRGAPVEVTLESPEGRAVLTVSDHGVGIAPEHRERVFQRFERVGITDAFRGMGLGLWIVKRIVDALGGRVEVESELGKGAAFRVELPR